MNGWLIFVKGTCYSTIESIYISKQTTVWQVSKKKGGPPKDAESERAESAEPKKEEKIPLSQKREIESDSK